MSSENISAKFIVERFRVHLESTFIDDYAQKKYVLNSFLSVRGLSFNNERYV